MTGPLTEEVTARLRERAKAGDLPAVIVLPSQLRGSSSYYSEFDLEAIKSARAAGVDAEFLHRADERRYLSEHSAGGVLLAFAVSVLQDLTVDGLKSVGAYVLAQLRAAKSRRIIEEPDDADLRIDVGRIRVTSEEVEVEQLHIEAHGEGAISALLLALGKKDDAVEALRQLDLTAGTPELTSDRDPKAS